MEKIWSFLVDLQFPRSFSVVPCSFSFAIMFVVFVTIFFNFSCQLFSCTQFSASKMKKKTNGNKQNQLVDDKSRKCDDKMTLSEYFRNKCHQRGTKILKECIFFLTFCDEIIPYVSFLFYFIRISRIYTEAYPCWTFFLIYIAGRKRSNKCIIFFMSDGNTLANLLQHMH